MMKKYPTLGCCGLDCGLCPRYYTKGSSRCPGCLGGGFLNKHPSCSFINCCVKKRYLEVCAECTDFPCAKFDRETGETDSFVSHRMVISNQNFIKEYGIEKYIEKQKKRMGWLDMMLLNYDDGKHKSFFCLAAALLPLENLNKAVLKAEREIKDRQVGQNDLKSKAVIINDILNQFASEEGVELKLRKARN